MDDVWRTIVGIGSLITALSVAPYLLGMVGITMSLDMQTAEPEMLLRMMELFVGALLAMVPLSIGGVLVYAFFQFADEMAT